jgi:ribosomal protein L11 methyltransferase
MKYIEIAAAVPTAEAERGAEILRAHTEADVSMEVPFTQADLESDAVLSTGGTAIVRAYVTDGDAGRALARSARDAFARAGMSAEVTARDVAEEDWAEAWKEYFHVEHYGKRIVVVPSWREYEAQPEESVLRLDPGMAFGTGQHETTRMCLEALERSVVPGARVVDVGCGSGILAIAAAKLGARDVYAVDVDPNCVRVTRENAQINGVDGVVRVAAGSLDASWPFADDLAGRCDLVVANIIARVIIELAPAAVGALRPGGRLVVSGIIGEREVETRTALEAAGARIESTRAMEDWRCIEAVRP